MIKYHISFDTIADSIDGKHPEVEVIDYQYGTDENIETVANREMVRLGETFKRNNVTITMPEIKFLYVKWRILATGEVLEDRVELATRLPEEMDGLYLHFIMRDQQLYLFLIDRRWDSKPRNWEPRESKYKSILGKIKIYEGHRYTQLYPEPPSSP